MKNDNLRSGAIAENIVHRKLLEAGYHIYTPILDGDQVDLIVRDPNKTTLIPISIKGSKIRSHDSWVTPHVQFLFTTDISYLSETRYVLICVDTEEMLILDNKQFREKAVGIGSKKSIKLRATDFSALSADPAFSVEAGLALFRDQPSACSPQPSDPDRS